MENRGNSEAIKLDKTTVTLEPETSSGGGLFAPGKDRVVYRPPERKSLLGLDVLAIAKREESKAEGGFKAPKDRGASVVASLEEEENNSESGVIDDSGDDISTGIRSHSKKRYRGISASDTPRTESTVTEDGQDNRYKSRNSGERYRTDVLATPSGSSHSARSQSSYNRDDRGSERRDYRGRSDRDDHDSERSDYQNSSRGDSWRERKRYGSDSQDYHGRREEHGRYEQEYGGEYERKRGRYEISKRTPGRSDWDDGRWEWEETPRRDGYSNNSRRHQPSRSPMLLGASPDARLVSPWLGGNTPRSGSAASPWDHISPSPVPIRASGYSSRSSSLKPGARSHQLTFSSENSQSLQGGEGDDSDLVGEQTYEISESMHAEMEYHSDRAW